MIACVLADTCLVYLVLSPTVTGVCVVLPPASVTVTLMVVPATEATTPWTIRFAGFGVPEGAGVLEGAVSLPCVHLPSTAGLIRTDPAVIAWSPCDSPCVGRTLTQLPAVTSVRVAAVVSVTFVASVKSTVALPFWAVTWAALPDTDAIRPLTRAWPAGVGVVGLVGDAEGVVVALDVGEEPDDPDGPGVFDEPHAAMEKAAIPLTAKIVNRVSGVGREGADIKVSPINRTDDQIYRLELCGM